jgi:uncharacterized protein (TIGR00255 family)
MIRSMTGFGEAQLEEDSHVYHIELRGVNNRYFKLSMRLPEEFVFIETGLERRLRKRITRGSLSVRLSVRDLTEAAAQDLNIAAIQHYVAQLRTAAADPNLQIDLATLATLPGVCQPHDWSDDRRRHCGDVLLELVETALENLIEMRAAEGKALAADLTEHCRRLRSHLDQIRTLAARVVENYRERLHARIDELLADCGVRLAEEDLLKEVAIYAERSDISEELSRLGSHLEQFDAAVAGDESAGRKLEFIAQEMLREANTIGSKAGDAEIARHTIEIKSAIDRIKEQVQNVE